MKQQMSTKDKESVLTLYSRLMDELKQRSMLLGQLSSGSLNFPIIPTFELCQLQTRLICEIFALACLTAHGDIPDVKSAMMQKEYNADKIIGRLDRLHPNFYPVPHKKEVSADAIPGALPARFHNVDDNNKVQVAYAEPLPALGTPVPR